MHFLSKLTAEIKVFVIEVLVSRICFRTLNPKFRMPRSKFQTQESRLQIRRYKAQSLKCFGRKQCGHSSKLLLHEETPITGPGRVKNAAWSIEAMDKGSQILRAGAIAGRDLASCPKQSHLCRQALACSRDQPAARGEDNKDSASLHDQ